MRVEFRIENGWLGYQVSRKPGCRIPGIRISGEQDIRITGDQGTRII